MAGLLRSERAKATASQGLRAARSTESVSVTGSPSTMAERSRAPATMTSQSPGLCPHHAGVRSHIASIVANMAKSVDMDQDLGAVLTAVGPRLRALRRQRDTTLAALAETTGISVSTLSRLESGRRRPT